MGYIEIDVVEDEPESKEYRDRLVSVHKAINTLREDLYLLDPSERAVLVKEYISEVSPKEVAMSMYYGSTTRATLIAELIRKEDHTLIEDIAEKVLKWWK